MASYTDPILDKLISKLNATGPTKLKNKYMIGDPIVPPLSDLPLCFVSRDTTTITIDTTVEDMHTMPIVLNVVYAAANDLNQKAFAQAGTIALYDLCEGRDSSYNLRDDTIAGVLRNNQVLDGNNKLYIDIGTGTNIEYVLSPPSRRGIFSVEAIIRTTLINQQVRP